MDPISQGVLGATFSMSFFRRENFFPVMFVGAISGMAADLDIFISSSVDPIFFLEFHRQFTHSLIFIPIGSLIVALSLYYFMRKHLLWRELYIVCFLGYSTHAVLDACATYGTQLFWPFSNERVAWNNISVIDPLFTLPIILFLMCAYLKRSRVFIFLGLGWVIFYISIGFIQRERALSLGHDIALSRGHSAVVWVVKPSIGNLILWKTVYEFEDFYYVDAIRLTTDVQHCPGQRIAKFDLKKHLKHLKKDSQQAQDIERFRKFSAGYLSFDPEMNLIMDTRYSLLPNEITPLWGIVVNPHEDTEKHVKWWQNRVPNKAQRSKFIALLGGGACQFFLSRN
jgi:inner membrane protein